MSQEKTPPRFDPFPLTDDDLARLKVLGERTRHEGIGIMASANYHGQGRVHVPSAWLVEIIERLERGNAAKEGLPPDERSGT